MIEVVKDVAAVVGCVLSCASLVTLIVKPIRKRVVAFISQSAKTDELERLSTKFDSFSAKMLDEIERVSKENQMQSEKLDLCIGANQAALGNSIKHIYEKYRPEHQLPLHEKAAIVALHDSYKSVGGNHYVDELFKEMMSWGVAD